MQRFLAFLLIACTQALHPQIQNPLISSAPGSDIAAYWYNVPKDSMLLKVMGTAIPFHSTLELYAEAPADSFRVSLTAERGAGEKIYSGNFSVQRTGSNPSVRLLWRGKFFRMIVPVQYQSEPPSRITVEIQSRETRQVKTIECRYHRLSGRITDFEGKPFRAVVLVRPDDFDGTAGIWSNAEGKYSILLPERIYGNMFVDDESYGMETAEAWGWHIIMDSDQTLDYKVGTGEVYNLNVWPNNGGARTHFLSFRPMSVFFYRTMPPPLKEAIEGKTYDVLDVGARLKSSEVTVKFNGKQVPIVSLQKYYEWTSGRLMPAYVLQVSREGLEGTDKQSVVVEYQSESEFNGKKIVHSSMGVFQFYPNFTGHSFF